MSDYRFEIDAQAGPAREGILHGRAQLLVRYAALNTILAGD
jgi:hypothetical protein